LPEGLAARLLGRQLRPLAGREEEVRPRGIVLRPSLRGQRGMERGRIHSPLTSRLQHPSASIHWVVDSMRRRSMLPGMTALAVAGLAHETPAAPKFSRVRPGEPGWPSDTAWEG